MIEITEKAAEKLVATMMEENKNPDDHYLRVGVRGGGCSGLSYVLEFVDGKDPEDHEVVTDHGIKLIVNKKSLLYLMGTHLDFSDGLNGKGFQFLNPNASRTCGCGESFAV